MKFFLVFALALVSLNDVTLARSMKAENDVELREVLLNLRDALHSQKKRAEEEAQGMEHLMVARGAWDDFKASLKKAGSKVKNAFGKKNEEEEGRQFEGFGDPSAGVSDAELKMYKQEIVNWKQMVRDFSIQNDPEIKKMEAQLDLVWNMLNLDDV